MPSRAEIFVEMVRPVLRRFFLQTGHVAPTDEICATFADQLWRLVEERGLPPPLAAGECGDPQEMSKDEVAPLIERLLAGTSATDREALATPARQLVKACFHGDFKVCRDSYRELSPDGSCRRQELKRVRERVSGSHCVDCPYWTGLEPTQHAKFLAREWHGDPAVLAADLAVYLPEDFRVLRRFIREQAVCNRS